MNQIPGQRHSVLLFRKTFSSVKKMNHHKRPWPPQTRTTKNTTEPSVPFSSENFETSQFFDASQASMPAPFQPMNGPGLLRKGSSFPGRKSVFVKSPFAVDLTDPHLDQPEIKRLFEDQEPVFNNPEIPVGGLGVQSDFVPSPNE